MSVAVGTGARVDFSDPTRECRCNALAQDRILKVARTIADHLAEAVQYPSLDRSYWSWL